MGADTDLVIIFVQGNFIVENGIVSLGAAKFAHNEAESSDWIYTRRHSSACIQVHVSRS